MEVQILHKQSCIFIFMHSKVLKATQQLGEETWIANVKTSVRLHAKRMLKKQ